VRAVVGRRSGPCAAAGGRIEHDRPRLVVHTRRAVLLAAGVAHRDPARIPPDHQLAAAAVALDQFDVRTALDLPERRQLETAAAALADLHLPRQRLHLAVALDQARVLAKAVFLGLHADTIQLDGLV